MYKFIGCASWKKTSIHVDNVRFFQFSWLETTLVFESQKYIHGRSSDCKLIEQKNVVLKKRENVVEPGCRWSANGERRRANRYFRQTRNDDPTKYWLVLLGSAVCPRISIVKIFFYLMRIVLDDKKPLPCHSNLKWNK